VRQVFRAALISITGVGLALSFASPGEAVPVRPHDTTPAIAFTGRPCPSKPVQLQGTGFADGAYVIQTSAGALTTSRGHASGGSLQAVTLQLPAAMPQAVTVTATDLTTDTVVASQEIDLAGSVTSAGNRLNPWKEPVSADCFAPGEHVSLQVGPSPKIAAAPTQLIADAQGKVATTLPLTASGQPSFNTAVFSAQTSSQHVSLDLLPVPGTTLQSGNTIADDGVLAPNELMSPTLGYDLTVFSGTVTINHWNANGTHSVVYSAGHDPSPAVGGGLRMGLDGNLVATSHTGATLWSTATSGSGDENSVVMQQDGNLVMRTSSGVPVWSSVTGTVGTANNLHTYAYISSSRARSAVYINGLIKQATMAPTLARGAGRTVYLQRYLGGTWQNVLSRTSNSTGQLSVGFIQNTVYQYRLLVSHSSTGASATSAGTIR
jgi:hypothetical protein